MATVHEAIESVAQRLKLHSASPRLDAELLVGWVIDRSRAELFAYPEVALTEQQEAQLGRYVQRRFDGEPMAYLLGQQEFWSLNLNVDSTVLIPRPETELLVEWALNHFPKNERIRLADLGTGSGAIAVALAHERLNWHIDATDQSEEALRIAQQNAALYAGKNIQFYAGSWCQALPCKDYHGIVSNPPYIAENDAHLQRLKYEPLGALSAGESGLDAIEVIIAQAKRYLLPGGWLVLEHGYDQKECVIALMEKENYREIKDHSDLAGLARMIVARSV